MENVALRNGDWVVVCDGRKALILVNEGDEKFPNLRTKEVHDHVNPPTHEQGASRPGRSFESVGSHRSAMEQTDWHDQAERTFLEGIAERLGGAVEGGEARAVTIVASPRALGMIRPAYSSALRNAVAREVAKDLVNQPVHEIERIVTKAD